MRVRKLILKRFTPNFAGLTVLWVVMVESDLSSWPVAIPTIAIASSVFLLWPGVRHPRFNLLAGGKYAVVFLWRCFVAGLDVTRRVFGSPDAIEPGMAEYKLSLPDAASRSFLANTVSLLPGTLSTAIVGDVLRMHVLDTRTDFASDVARFERLVGQMLRRPGVFPSTKQGDEA